MRYNKHVGPHIGQRDPRKLRPGHLTELYDKLLAGGLRGAFRDLRKRMDYAEAYVRRMLANTLVSSKRRAWVHEQPWGEVPEAVAAKSRLAPNRSNPPRAVALAFALS